MSKSFLICLGKCSAVVKYCGPSKGEEPSTTLAWPGWKQPDIPVEVDTARNKLVQEWFCKMFIIILP